MGDLDIATKALMREVPEAVARLVLGEGARISSAKAERFSGLISKRALAFTEPLSKQ